MSKTEFLRTSKAANGRNQDHSDRESDESDDEEGPGLGGVYCVAGVAEVAVLGRTGEDVEQNLQRDRRVGLRQQQELPDFRNELSASAQKREREIVAAVLAVFDGARASARIHALNNTNERSLVTKIIN